MTKFKLHQVIAIEGGTKSRVNSFASEAYKLFQKPALFNGVSKVYAKKNEGEEDLPAESQRVQRNAEEMIRTVWGQTGDLFDIVATKDLANCGAKADVVVDGQVLLRQAPATFLLFLEKQFKDVRAEIVKLPELDQAVNWSYDQNTGNFRSDAIQTIRTKKEQTALVMYPATPEHPAQTQLVTKDVLAGTWSTTYHSGAMPSPRKKDLLTRIDKLIDALRIARETANEIEVEKQSVAGPIFGYLLG